MNTINNDNELYIYQNISATRAKDQRVRKKLLLLSQVT